VVLKLAWPRAKDGGVMEWVYGSIQFVRYDSEDVYVCL